MTTRPKWTFFLRSLASTIDQALLSALNFAVGIALIRLASKEAYGYYTLLFAGGTLATTLLDALLGSALMTLAARMEPAEREAFVARTARLQWSAASLAAVVLGCAAGIGVQRNALNESAVLIGVLFALYIVALSAREFCRTALFIDAKPIEVLKIDTLFAGSVALLAMALYAWRPEVTVAEAIAVLLLANGVAATFASLRIWHSARGTPLTQFRADMRKLWALSRWAFVGAVMGWVGNNAYLYLSSLLLDVSATAELNAGRLLLIPIGLVSVAWCRVALPAASQMVGRHDWQALDRFGLKSTGAILLVSCSFVGVLLAALPWLQANVLGAAKYANMSSVVPYWSAYFLLNGVRMVSTTQLMAAGAFKPLFLQGSVSLSILLVACVTLIPQFGMTGAIAAMVIVEVVELLTNHLLLLPRARKAPPAPSEQAHGV